MESKVVVSSIWEDDELFKISIFGSNVSFSGQADCYTTRDKIKQLGNILESFPCSVSDQFEFTTRETEDLSFFSISGFCIDSAGHTLFAITIAHIESFTNVRNENYKVNFDLKVEPQAINTFGRLLLSVATEPLAKTKAVLKNAI